ncbi:hypothetical protein ACWD0J_39505 [Streptomyces sp. NPDC003011]
MNPTVVFGLDGRSAEHVRSWADKSLVARQRAQQCCLTPREGWDHSTPYLKRILADVWQADLVVIERELTLAATTPGMEHLHDRAAGLHTKALAAARHAGREIAAK